MKVLQYPESKLFSRTKHSLSYHSFIVSMYDTIVCSNRNMGKIIGTVMTDPGLKFMSQFYNSPVLIASGDVPRVLKKWIKKQK